MKITFSLLTASLLPLFAQSPGVPIFDQSQNGLREEEKAIISQVEQLNADQKLLPLTQAKELLTTPILYPISLPQPNSQILTPSQISKVAHQASFRVGWAYLCKKCDHWHLNLAGGYAVSPDGIIATCSHVIDTDTENMREGSPIAVDSLGKVHPITTILANDSKMDAALVKIESPTTALPFNSEISPGDPAFCLSRPLRQGQYFTQGIVNRFYWSDTPTSQDLESLETLRSLRLNVSSRWAPGSSGSAVLDQYGNCIGHVSTILLLGKDKNNPQITFHNAVPARSVKKLSALPSDSNS